MQRQFVLQPSFYLAALLSAAHGITLAALLPLALPVWVKAALAFIILFSLAYHLWRDAWLAAPSSTRSLTLDEDQIKLSMRDGRQVTGAVAHDSMITPFITVLNVLPQGARLAHSVIILPDSLDAESFRQLRVYLKWGG